ncbi:MAG TPA: guanylate kinase, partial [Pelobium sp.]|nr:guanylate kinase [Pelobium sp.]
GRGTETKEKVQERIDKAGKELGYAPKFDVILQNNDLATACKTAEELLLTFIGK